MVERSSSSVIFLSTRTSTFAVKIVKTMFDECAFKRLVDSSGFVDDVTSGVHASGPSDCGEKNTLV